MLKKRISQPWNKAYLVLSSCGDSPDRNTPLMVLSIIKALMFLFIAMTSQKDEAENGIYSPEESWAKWALVVLNLAGLFNYACMVQKEWQKEEPLTLCPTQARPHHSCTTQLRKGIIALNGVNLGLTTYINGAYFLKHVALMVEPQNSRTDKVLNLTSQSLWLTRLLLMTADHTQDNDLKKSAKKYYNLPLSLGYTTVQALAILRTYTNRPELVIPLTVANTILNTLNLALQFLSKSEQWQNKKKDTT